MAFDINSVLNPGPRIPPDVLARAGARYDEYGSLILPVFRTVNDYVRYVSALGDYATPDQRAQAQDMARSPEKYYIPAGGANGSELGNAERNGPSGLPGNVPRLRSSAPQGPMGAFADVGSKAGLAMVTAGLLPGGGAPVGGSASVGGGLAADGTLGAATPIAGLHAAVPGAVTAGGNLAAGAGSAGLAGAATTPLGGVRPGDGRDLATGLGDFFTNPRNLAGLSGIIASLVASRNSGGNSQATDQAMADASRLNKITEARMRRVDPMHEAVTQLAFGRLPVSSRNGIQLPRVPLPPQEG